ncbi:type II secretion system F family protein [Salisediminibacterium beveridgei]|uniref:Flp pilus assembly protein TadB n=1 Tax=Salisediminibacterium beveridgei TaxID=632773 RepID=A0A1D7QY15_9BACI|nr:type II secretion system F family protein [Salisediminibacterium beveridgei]AOM83858.1 Flp pilus assembly protein TadB [Salisediminibacterium beveridgei]
MTPLLLTMLLITSTLVFLSILQLFVKKETVMEERVNRYLRDQPDPGSTKDEVKQKRKLPVPNFTQAKRRIRAALKKNNKNEVIELLLSQAGVPLKPEEYVMFRWISLMLTAGILYLISDSILLLVIGAFIGRMIPGMVVKSKKRKRIKAFNDHLPDMITTVVGALRAGFSFTQALKSVEEEASSPMKEEVGLVVKEMQYGMTVEEALNRFKDRVPSEDLNLMIQAIIIQRQIGGNLATVLEKISQTIRDRIQVQGQIKTLTAQGRMSGAVVGSLPIALGMILFLIEPDYVMVMFTHPVGMALIALAAVSSLIGFLLIRKVTAIEV